MELTCFKRVPTPSSRYDSKSQTYFQTTGDLRQLYTHMGYNTLPVTKGKFYKHPAYEAHFSVSSPSKAKARRRPQTVEAKVETLPDEELTAAILDEIYPQDPGSTPSGSAAKKEERVSFAPNGCESPDKRGRAKHKRRLGNLGHTFDSLVLQEPVPSMSSTPAPTPKSVSGNFGHGAVASSRHTASTPSIGGSGPLVQALTAAGSQSLNRNSSHGLNSTSGGSGLVDGGSTLGPGSRSAKEVMQEFRNQLIERFHSVREAFEYFNRVQEMPAAKEVTRKEWRRILVKHGLTFASTEDRDTIMEALPHRPDGYVSVYEFHTVVEAAAPVKTFEDLRRRWLASGFQSMNQAFTVLDQNGTTTSTPLSQKEFGEALSRVHVTEVSEHQALFQAASCDDTGRCSIGELASAVATVSPDLLLEDLRDRLLRKYSGSTERAFVDMDVDRSGSLSREEFQARAVHRTGLSVQEARLLFRVVDYDCSAQVTRSEFVCSLALAEPSLHLEELRLKVRQRFRSINEALMRGLDEDGVEDLGQQSVKLRLNQFCDLLRKEADGGINEQEVRVLFMLIDVDRDEQLTIREFMRGLLRFAPSCVLEDLRIACLARHLGINEAFEGVDRYMMLNLGQFHHVLEGRGLVGRNGEGLDLQRIFDVIDVKHDGQVNLARLISALKACGAGALPRLTAEELDDRARNDVKHWLARSVRCANDLRNQVRTGHQEFKPLLSRDASPDSLPDRPRSPFPEERSPAIISAQPTPAHMHTQSASRAKLRQAIAQMAAGNKSQSASPERRKATGSPPVLPDGGGSQAETSGGHFNDGRVHRSQAGLPPSLGDPVQGMAPRLKKFPAELLTDYVKGINFRAVDPKKPSQVSYNGGIQATWNGIWDNLKKSPGAERPERHRLVEELHTYSQSTAWSLSHDVPLLLDRQSVIELHQSSREHHEALKPGKYKALLAKMDRGE